MNSPWLDYFFLNGRFYPYRWIDLGNEWGEVLVSVMSLNTAIFDINGQYLSEQTRIIDELIFFFVEDFEISESEQFLKKQILSAL